MNFLTRHSRLLRFAVLLLCGITTIWVLLRNVPPAKDLGVAFRADSQSLLDQAGEQILSIAASVDRLSIAGLAGAGVFDATAIARPDPDSAMPSSAWRLNVPAQGKSGESVEIIAPDSLTTTEPPGSILSLAVVLDRISSGLVAQNVLTNSLRFVTQEGWQVRLRTRTPVTDSPLPDWKVMQQTWAAGTLRDWTVGRQPLTVTAASPVRQNGRLVAAALATAQIRNLMAPLSQQAGELTIMILHKGAPVAIIDRTGVLGPDGFAAAEAMFQPAVLAAATSPSGAVIGTDDFQVLGSRVDGTPFHVAVIGTLSSPYLHSPFEDNAIRGLLMVILILGVMLFISDRLAKREFIRPARALISHIEAENRNIAEPPPGDVPENWKPWFTTISRIFEENRSLVRHLTETLENLDNAVDERTRELQHKNSELELALKKLREAQDQIVSQEKLASLGALTAGIAHEIKNPLNFVTNFAQSSVELATELEDILKPRLAALPGQDRDEVTGLIEDIRNNAERIDSHGKRADSIVKSMLAHARESSGAPERTNINTLIRESANLAYHGRRAQDRGFNVTLDYVLSDDLPDIKVVPQELNRVVLNLVGNAFDAVRERQAKDPKDYAPQVTLSSEISGSLVVLKIRDNGSGIPDAIREKLFTPFFTTKPTGSGTGLGLSICHDIVRRHGGRITLDSTPGSYTEFTITLPMES
ncbi:MAG: ATP-binding protein [Rhodospirillales bacterium]